jgi:hypothetical protein
MKDVLKVYFIGLFILLSTSISFHFTIRIMFRMVDSEPNIGSVGASILLGVVGVVVYGYLLEQKSKNGGL